MNRRGFFKGVAGVALAFVFGRAVFKEQPPEEEPMTIRFRQHEPLTKPSPFDQPFILNGYRGPIVAVSKETGVKG